MATSSLSFNPRPSGVNDNYMTMFTSFFLLSLTALAMAGCTTKTAYLSTQDAQRDACDRIADMPERQHCRAKANTSYEDYQQQREAAKTRH
jgi:hypothetical protein